MTTPLRLYNTLTRSKEVFRPIDPENVRLYVCGPTVYDFAHIGNARPIIVFDLLFRLLRHLYGADAVTYVRNITDVDDKINARAFERGIPIRELTDETARQFHADIKALGVLMPEDVNEEGKPPRLIEPRATDHIGEMREIIERLVERGAAYVAEDHVLFSVAAMERLPGVPRYGAFSKRSLDELIAGARVDVAPYKREPMDFVLWKPSGPQDPSWPSPAGIATPGRPGWHIECSAMAWRHLVKAFETRLACDDPMEREIFDIHGGGIDLVFPHHENEIAQTACAFGLPRMANVWMHNGFLQVEGEKMSKSVGNFVTVHELLQDWPGEVLRFNMLRTHYTQPINWRSDLLAEAKTEMTNWAILVQSLPSDIRHSHGSVNSDVIDALSDDMNTAEAIKVLRSLFSEAKVDETKINEFWQSAKFIGLLDESKLYAHLPTGAISAGLIVRWGNIIEELKIAKANGLLDQEERRIKLLAQNGVEVVFGKQGQTSVRFKASYRHEVPDVESLVQARSAARLVRDWAESDRIRDELAAMGVAVKDNKDGTTTVGRARQNPPPFAGEGGERSEPGEGP